eukprot:scaffold7368_cov144-Skeletonema_menzelii.AAC.5
MFLDVVYRVEWFSQESIVTSHATWCGILTAATAQIDWAACIKVYDTCQHFTRVVALKMGVFLLSLPHSFNSDLKTTSLVEKNVM